MKKMMTVLTVVVFTCSTLLFMASCAKKNVMQGEGQVKAPVVVQPSAPPSPASPVVTPPKGEDRATTELSAEQKARKAAIDAISSGSIYFDFDRSELKAQAKEILAKKAEYLRKYPDMSVSIEGHCDERGTNEYNLALGERRANAAFKYLNAMGITGNRLTTVSYGEERPADPGHDENAWSKNRRDEFKVINK